MAKAKHKNLMKILLIVVGKTFFEEENLLTLTLED
jgi:hypothetical protein